MTDTNWRHKKALFNPRAKKPFGASRAKVDLFLRCPRCFYLNQRLGVKIPGGAPFVLNIQIDKLLKNDANRLRANQQPDPKAQKFGINAVPFDHPNIKRWLDIFNKGKYDGGMEYFHRKTNLIVSGAPDDIWLVNNSELSTVDVKATHSNKEIEESFFWEENKRQAELYSWLLARQNLPYPVSNTSYFVRINTKKDQDSFDNDRLQFESKVIAYTCNHAWIEPTLLSLKECLVQSELPVPNKKCGYCKYRTEAAKFEK